MRDDGKRTGLDERVVNADNRVSIRSLGYDYDNAGKLTSETGQDGLGVAYANSWNYDAVGNRTSATVQKAATAGATTWAHTTSVSAVFNANDQLASQSSSVDGATATSQNFSYDANGAEAGTSTASGTSSNGWDFEGKLTGTALADASGTASGGSANVFDAQGDRLAHTDNLGKTGQKTTSYLVDSNTSYAQVIEERAPDVSDAAGAPGLQARYVWGEGFAPLAMWRKMPDGSVKLFFHLSDGQESVRQLTDASGAVTDSYFYDAWGNALAGSTNNVVNPFRYTGQQLDPDGRYYLRARFYNPGKGRFLSHDPLMGSESDPVSLHRYLYAGADGVNACDPSGKFTLVEMTISVAIGLAIPTGAYTIYEAWRVGPDYSATVAFTSVEQAQIDRLKQKIYDSNPEAENVFAGLENLGGTQDDVLGRNGLTRKGFLAGSIITINSDVFRMSEERQMRIIIHESLHVYTGRKGSNVDTDPIHRRVYGWARTFSRHIESTGKTQIPDNLWDVIVNGATPTPNIDYDYGGDYYYESPDTSQ